MAVAAVRSNRCRGSVATPRCHRSPRGSTGDKHEENTKRIRREYEENTNAYPKPLPSTTLAARSPPARAWLAIPRNPQAPRHESTDSSHPPSPACTEDSCVEGVPARSESTSSQLFQRGHVDHE